MPQDSMTAALARAESMGMDPNPVTIEHAAKEVGTALAPVETRTSAAPPSSVDEFMARQGLSLSNWLGVIDAGIRINKLNPPVKTLDVELDLTGIVFTTAIRWDNAGRTAFDKTFDGKVSFKSGMDWQAMVTQCKAMDPKCRGSYASADIPLKLLQEVKAEDAKDQPVVFAKDSMIGFSTNLSSMKEFVAFLPKMIARVGKNGTVKVRLSRVMRTGFSTPTAVIAWDFLDA